MTTAAVTAVIIHARLSKVCKALAEWLLPELVGVKLVEFGLALGSKLVGVGLVLGVEELPSICRCFNTVMYFCSLSFG